MATPKKTTTRKSPAISEKPAPAPKVTPAALAATQVIKPAAKPVAPIAKPTAPAASPAPKASAPTTVTAVPVAKPVVAKPATKSITQSQWRSMVEEAAYYRAERSGFSGDPQDHWDSAEKEIRERLKRDGVSIV